MKLIKYFAITVIAILAVSFVVIVLYVNVFSNSNNNENQTTYLKQYDVQITGVTFHLNFTSVTIHLENNGKTSFKFNSDNIVNGTTEIVTMESQQSFDFLKKHLWEPNKEYTFTIHGVYEGKDEYSTLKFTAKSPTEYPQDIEIINVSTDAQKVYDELGALKPVNDAKVTLTIANKLDVDMVISEINNSHVNVELLAGQTANVTIFKSWEGTTKFTFLARAQVDDYSQVYYSNFYTWTAFSD